MTQDLLIELGCEDLPARYVAPLAQALAKGTSGGLAKRGVAVGAQKIFATPRRIAVLLQELALRQADQNIDRKGPAVAAAFKDGQPTPAALGFARSCGVEIAKLKQKDGHLVFRKKQKGRKTAELIPEVFEETLKQMDELVPKRMRWGDGSETFVRPVQWIVALLGSRIVPVQRFGLKSGRKTFGHRFHAPKAIALKTPADYDTALKNAKVHADFAGRRDEIARQVKAEAAKLGGVARVSADLLDEVTALVEWPVAISGRIEPRFLELPPEVIVATVETNQRYFTVFDAAGKLLPYFVTVSNIESRDVSQVASGNERVVRPRLTDALFFWQQDLKLPLEAYGEKLKSVTFQKDLGSVAGKVGRGRNLARQIAALLQADTQTVERAAFLCKNDLVTRMVYEFPELQGIMGGYYAEKSGEPPEVAQAVREHYQPTQAGGTIPSSPAGRIVALADKLDTLAGIFAIGQKPTASKDPFALRRAALGALRICLEGRLALDAAAMLKAAAEAQPAGKRDEATLKELTEFVLERLRSYYTDQQLPTEMFEAVKALGITTPLDFDARVQALRAFWALPAAKSLAAAHKRIRNILKQAGGVDTGKAEPSLFEHETEKQLMATLESYGRSGLASGDYAGKLAWLAEQLQQPVDAFFDAVMVMAPDEKLRNNRLALLRRLDAVCREVADISCLPG
jgi:glycyl-tRNA synthetase beta chain